MYKVVVGSTNPVKCVATKEAFDLLGVEFEIEAKEIDSGVSDQPTSDAEAIKGAITRARRIMESEDPDYSVGIEGSTHDTGYGMFLTGWACILKWDGTEYLGGGGRLKLPENIADRLRRGEELGPVMDEITGEEDVKKGPGAIGIFTDGIITREEAYKSALVFAMSKLIRPDLYR